MVNIRGRDEKVASEPIYGRGPGGLNTENLNLPTDKVFVWVGPTADYTWPTAAITHISSSSASDTGLMLVEGVSYPDWYNVSFLVTLQGQTKVALPTPLARFNYARSCCNLVGDVYIYQDTAISGGIPSDLTKVSGYVSSLYNQSKHGGYAIPYGYKALIRKVLVTTRLSATGSLYVYFYSRSLNAPFANAIYLDQTLAFAQGSGSVLEFEVFDLPFLGGSELWVEADAPLANNFGITVNIVLEKILA